MDTVPTGRELSATLYLVQVFVQPAHYTASGNPEESRSRLSDAPDRGLRELRCQCRCPPSRMFRPR